VIIQIASLHQINMGTTLLGAFSTPAKAIKAGEDAIRDIIGKEPNMLDWDYEYPECRYFFEAFTLMITETTLDQAL